MVRKRENTVLLYGTSLYLLILYLIPERTKIATIAFCAVLGLALLIQRKFVYNRAIVLPLIVFIIGGIALLPFSVADLSNAIEIIVSLVIGILLVCVNYTEKYRADIIKGIMLTSCVAVIGCVLQLVAVNLLFTINRITLGAEKYELFHMFYRGNNLVGFSYQTAVTGFYLSLLAGYLGCKLFSRSIDTTLHRMIALIMMVCTYCMLFFTGKRIFILLSLFGIAVIFCAFNKKHILKVVIGVIILLLGVWMLFTYTEYGQKLIMRSMVADPTTGRATIYRQLIEWFWERPILGNGLGSTLTLLQGYQNGHNVYLQLLSESGIVGFVLMVTIFIVSFIRSIRLLHNCVVNQTEKVIGSFCVFVQIIFLGWCFTGNPLYDVYPLVVYMIINGLIFKMSREYIGR